MNLVLALILLPLAVGAALFFLRPFAIRRIIVSVAVLAVCCLSIALATLPVPIDLKDLPLSPHAIGKGMLVVEIVMSLFILYVGIRARNVLVVLLTLAQAGLMTWFELGPGAHLEVAQDLFVDKFSVIMALINGVVGGGICLYALGYMREYHEVAHREVRGPAAVVLRAAVHLHGRHVRHHLRQQPAVAVPVLGNHHALLVPADRLHADGGGAAECACGRW